MLARRAGWFSLRCDYGLGCRVIAVCIGRPIIVAIPPWPSADILTIAEKMMPGEMMPGEMSKVMRREMASSVKRVHAHAMASTACVDRHKE